MTRDELLTAVLVERFGPDAAQSRPLPPRVLSPETRQQLIDDLPPDSRPHTVTVQATRS